MNGLVRNGSVEFVAPNIEFGEFEGEEKWRLFDGEQTLLYIIDENHTLIEFQDELLPTDFVASKYCYENGEFVPNPHYIPPALTISEQIKLIAHDIQTLTETGDTTEEALCELNMITEERLADVEQALCELSEIVLNMQKD